MSQDSSADPHYICEECRRSLWTRDRRRRHPADAPAMVEIAPGRYVCFRCFSEGKPEAEQPRLF